MNKKKKIGLALGGGGARGFAHLGVLRALKNADIEADVLSGTSMGAIIAVAYLQKRTINHSEISLKHFVNQYARRFDSISFTETAGYQRKSFFRGLLNTFNNGIKFMSLAMKIYSHKGQILDSIARDFIYPCNLEDLPKKVFICTTDIVSGQGVLMCQGDARKSIRACMSIAGCFPGVNLGKRILVDASAIFPIPIQAFLFEPVDIILACDVGVDIPANYKPASALDLLLRQYDLMSNHVASEINYCADYVIRPKLEDVHWTDFRRLELVLERGYEAGSKAIPEIKRLLASNEPRTPIDQRPWHDARYKNGPIVIDSFPSVKR